MYKIGDHIFSQRNPAIHGTVVGYGWVEWPKPLDKDTLTGDETPQTVYLVKVAIGSSTLGPACAVLRHDMVHG